MSITIAGKQYLTVGTIETMPMSLLAGTRKLIRDFEPLKDDVQGVMQYFYDNADTVFSVMSKTITFVLGEEQTAQAQEDIENMASADFLNLYYDAYLAIGDPISPELVA